MTPPGTIRRTPPAWTPWRTVVAFGVVSLAGDMVYEGMRSVAGPFLASLGASALAVGLITGAGEAIALVLRLFSGPYADHGGRYWSLTILGYAMTAICVPLLAVTPFVGSIGLALAATLILLERAGKAIRSPSKSTLLARVAVSVGRGRGFAVHKALDQVGAFAGPLLVAGVIALVGVTWPAFAVLAVPGAACMVLLFSLKRHTDDPENAHEVASAPDAAPAPVSTIVEPRALSVQFYAFATSCALGTLGLMTFGVISFHLVDAGLVSTAVVPLIYAAAMATEAVAALVTGFAYDRWGAAVLYTLPVTIVAVPALTLAHALTVVLAGVLLWGAVTGVQDSTVKALVADLVPQRRLATAYGVFAAFQGVAAPAGGVLAGGLYTEHRILLVVLVGLLQLCSAVLLVLALRRHHQDVPA
ncbi:MFS transporter [Marmoricola sp. URHB0036]|uniref:MFS transporter n=1 Tax=Marmoricola sp. URHB0036 TaxID=1298863 RepID=UPI00048411C3|nr:MFS transporter [Marmoricola sp. URHB0036]